MSENKELDHGTETLERIKERLHLTKIDILGTEYMILFSDASTHPKLEGANGLCEVYSKVIVIDSFKHMSLNDSFKAYDNLPAVQKKTIRHEIIHAFLAESGLRNCSSWAEDEEMVDWWACQIPKIAQVLDIYGVLR